MKILSVVIGSAISVISLIPYAAATNYTQSCFEIGEQYGSTQITS